jgi:hypothetical protein
MKNLSTAVLFTMFTASLLAQNTKPKHPIDYKKKPNDHIMLQIGNDNWANQPDSIKTTGVGRSLNGYIMMNFPFKTSPNFSVALGAGLGSSSIFLNEQEADITATSTNLVFRRTDTTNNFKKYKVASLYLEAPVELRWVANPANVDKSFKASLGAKVGLLLSGYTKGKELQNSSDVAINNYVQKEKSKRYFNSQRISLTARLGWGHFSIFGQYQATGLFKDNIAPTVRPYTIGIALSGL